jgi:hypothetical protein
VVVDAGSGAGFGKPVGSTEAQESEETEEQHRHLSRNSVESGSGAPNAEPACWKQGLWLLKYLNDAEKNKPLVGGHIVGLGQRISV